MKLTWQQCLTRKDRLEAIASQMGELTPGQGLRAWLALKNKMLLMSDPEASRLPKFNDLLLAIVRAHESTAPDSVEAGDKCQCCQSRATWNIALVPGVTYLHLCNECLVKVDERIKQINDAHETAPPASSPSPSQEMTRPKCGPSPPDTQE